MRSSLVMVLASSLAAAQVPAVSTPPLVPAVSTPALVPAPEEAKPFRFPRTVMICTSAVMVATGAIAAGLAVDASNVTQSLRSTSLLTQRDAFAANQRVNDQMTAATGLFVAAATMLVFTLVIAGFTRWSD